MWAEIFGYMIDNSLEKHPNFVKVRHAVMNDMLSMNVTVWENAPMQESRGSDGQKSPAGFHLYCTVHPTCLIHADQPKWPFSSTHMSTYSAAEGAGRRWERRPIENKRDNLAQHVPHLSPVHLLLLCSPLSYEDTLKDQCTKLTSPVWVIDEWVGKLIRSRNTAQRVYSAPCSQLTNNHFCNQFFALKDTIIVTRNRTLTVIHL